MSGFSRYLRKRQNASLRTLKPPFSLCLWNLIIMNALWVTLSLGSAWAQPWAPPSPPEIPPIISETYTNDVDGDRIDDELQAFADNASTLYLLSVTQTEKSDALRLLGSMIDVELIFKKPVTQQQIDDFLFLRGEISYIYRTVSYGWNGRIPLDKISLVPILMGPSFVMVERPHETLSHMDQATQTGRVRPIWQGGFAGNIGGFNGNPNITIGIIDTGVDETHADLAGRCAYWKDFSTENESHPVDDHGHGSHVAGIALGTGVSGGADRSTLRYTYTYLESEAIWTHLICPISLPSTFINFQSEAHWDGASAILGHVSWPRGTFLDNLEVNGELTKGLSPLRLTNSFRPSNQQVYSPILQAVSEYDTLNNVAITNSVTNYPGAGDSFNKFSGVAPDCLWAAAKVSDYTGGGYTSDSQEAFDDLVAERRSANIKVINLSRGAQDEDGRPATLDSYRSKVNSAVRNGIVVVVSAGNDADRIGVGYIEADRGMSDPARAALAITVGASNDENHLTEYSTYGFADPRSSEDDKPDVIAPGGSMRYATCIMSVDSSSSDCFGRPDQQPDDYANLQGTSMSSPFVAGCAALVIDAMQQKGISWKFTSDEHPRYVKMVLCATATETNKDRENGHYNPTLQREGFGPNGFPRGKDRYEGYGLINPDAAIEAVSLSLSWGANAFETLGPDPDGRRAWARTVHLSAGQRYNIELVNPSGCDFDLYLYSAIPSSTGTPHLLDWSTSCTRGADEQINRLAETSTDALLVVKRVSGTGRFQLKTTAQDTGEPTLPTLMPLPEFIKTYSHSTMTRGYWFEAPTDFRITGLRVPDETGNGRQNVEVVRFDNQTPPPGYGDTTNDFVSLVRLVDQPSSSILSVDIPVSRGDVIGILGATGTTTMHTSYGQNNFVSHIGGHSVTLKRLGMWYNLYENPAQDLYHSSNELGRVEMWYIAD